MNSSAGEIRTSTSDTQRVHRPTGPHRYYNSLTQRLQNSYIYIATIRNINRNKIIFPFRLRNFQKFLTALRKNLNFQHNSTVFQFSNAGHETARKKNYRNKIWKVNCLIIHFNKLISNETSRNHSKTVRKVHETKSKVKLSSEVLNFAWFLVFS